MFLHTLYLNCSIEQYTGQYTLYKAQINKINKLILLMQNNFISTRPTSRSLLRLLVLPLVKSYSFILLAPLCDRWQSRKILLIALATGSHCFCPRILHLKHSDRSDLSVSLKHSDLSNLGVSLKHSDWTSKQRTQAFQKIARQVDFPIRNPFLSNELIKSRRVPSCLFNPFKQLMLAAQLHRDLGRSCSPYAASDKAFGIFQLTC